MEMYRIGVYNGDNIYKLWSSLKLLNSCDMVLNIKRRRS